MNTVGPTVTRNLVSPAQMEVWRLTALGFSQTDTAKRLGKSRKTVEHQMAVLRRKLVITVEVEQ